MDLRLVALLGKYQEEELEAIERWFNHTQPTQRDEDPSVSIKFNIEILDAEM